MFHYARNHLLRNLLITVYTTKKSCPVMHVQEEYKSLKIYGGLPQKEQESGWWKERQQ